jgi:hypothetical protein
MPSFKGPRGRIFNYRHRGARKSCRANLGSLRKLVVSAVTEARYKSGLSRFFKWRETPGMRYLVDRPMDEQFSEYLCHLWEDGESRTYGAYALAGAQHFDPSIKHKIPGAWRLLLAWQKHEIPVRAPPFLPNGVMALAWVAHRNSRSDVALAIMVMFHAFLRPVEVVNLYAKDCVVSRNKTEIVLNLGQSKTGSRDGFVETTVLDDPMTVMLLRAWLLTAMPGDPLLPKGSLEFRAVFARLVSALKLPNGYKPYSLRRGGATHFFRRTGNLSLTCSRGRWSSEKTARIYVNEALAHLSEVNLPPSVLLALNSHAEKFAKLVDFAA